MNTAKKITITVSIMALSAVFILNGCAPTIKHLLVKKHFTRMPEVIAYLEPVLKNNKVFIVGKLAKPSRFSLKPSTGYLISRLDLLPSFYAPLRTVILLA